VTLANNTRGDPLRHQQRLQSSPRFGQLHDVAAAAPKFAPHVVGAID
jgi:hypothetical protein